jgi:hypothetical protein
MSGFANWLFDIEARRRSVIGRVELPGHTYLYALLAVSVVASTLFVLRYRKGEL